MAKNTTSSLSNEKRNGRIYTPNYIVNNILDLCGYKGEIILGKHIIDNSCGDGAFLIEVVKRYCEAAKLFNITNEQLRVDLESFIHGIEIDPEECEKCVINVSASAANYGISNINFDIKCADTLVVRKYDKKMDFVVGNPPYVRVHNLLNSYDSVKSYTFSQNGMTDLFIVFYEIGLKMLNDHGVLGYITPSSFFNSLAGLSMRKFITQKRNIKAIVDLKHFQPFAATTYTTIMILSNQPQNSVAYYEYDINAHIPNKISELLYEDFYFNETFVFGSNVAINEYKKIFKNAESVCEVKNGFATLYDDFFIGEWPFSDYTIPIIKASTGKEKKCLYPYDKNGKIITFEALTENPLIKSHYENNEEKLKSRSLDNPDVWYGFGRSQGINDVYKKKYAINSLIRDATDIKLSLCNPGTGVYSGLYILTKINFDELKSVLFTDEFINYIKMLRKYKSGGYYTFSSKDLQQFINFKFTKRSEYQHEQLTIY